ncbi:hypothetical protein JK361_37495 [Streptomyces sp. 5-8]|uniref:Transposase n=1 Tax=Streptomyces musisoli TaxID=2802280 RepID=A0ABS1PEC2_9ACTN|nr:hypothetical protein [Streptomyces musisoli]MBL1110186.1 hypothetical protein [Streptomyces musisoli]
MLLDDFGRLAVFRWMTRYNTWRYYALGQHNPVTYEQRSTTPALAA